MRCEASAVMTADGLQGLWRGVLPSLYRTVPGVGLYFSSMHCAEGLRGLTRGLGPTLARNVTFERNVR